MPIMELDKSKFVKLVVGQLVTTIHGTEARVLWSGEFCLGHLVVVVSASPDTSKQSYDVGATLLASDGSVLSQPYEASHTAPVTDIVNGILADMKTVYMDKVMENADKIGAHASYGYLH